MFYGWVIVAITFLTHFVVNGTIFYSYGILLKPIVEDLGGSRLAVSFALPLCLIVAGAAAPFVGRAVDRGSTRAVMLAGAVCLGGGFFALAAASRLWQFYLAFALPISVGMALLGGVANTALVANWFERRRGTALGISQIGVSISGMAMAYISSWLVSELGWRGTASVFGMAPLVLLIPLLWLFVVNRPEDRGLRPDGDLAPAREPETVAAVAAGDRWTAERVLRERTIWILAIVVGLNFAGATAVILQIYPHATDLGYSATQAASILSVMAGLAAFGKAVFGWLSDRFAPRGCLWLAVALQMLGLLGIINAPSHLSMLAASALFGLGYGGVMPLWGVLLGAIYGRLIFGTVMGLMTPMMVPFETLGIPFAGWVFDTTGSYHGAFVTFLGVYAAAALILVFLRVPKAEVERVSALIAREASEAADG